MTTTYADRPAGKTAVLVCPANHVTEIAWWAKRAPTVCPFTPCSQPFRA